MADGRPQARQPETPDTVGIADSNCLCIYKEQPVGSQLEEWVKEAKKQMKPLQQADGTTLDLVQYISVINMDDEDADAVECIFYYLYTHLLPPSQR
jgi:hypothetical protein